MTNASDLRSGKTHRDENFPVASRLIHSRHRALILAFYNFVRTADDIADHPDLDDAAKLALLDELDADLVGQGAGQREAVALRGALADRRMSSRHARDVLIAFRMDVNKRRYANWDELIHYCSFSAMPVGRFMLDVHGESKTTWPASDALCAALQINNHLQDCGDDFRELDRVYFPQDLMDFHGMDSEDLGKPKASAAMRACISELVRKTEDLMRRSASLTVGVADVRLGCEISVIETYAWKILELLAARDPLSDNVHLSKPALIGYGFSGVMSGLWRRTVSPRQITAKLPGA